MSEEVPPVFESFAAFRERVRQISVELERPEVQANVDRLEQSLAESRRMESAFQLDPESGRLKIDESFVSPPEYWLDQDAQDAEMRAFFAENTVIGQVIPALSEISRNVRVAKYHLKRLFWWGPVVVAEGDSWFDLPIPGFGKDIVDWLGDDYPVYPMSMAGDTTKNMTSDQNLAMIKQRIRSEQATFLLFSGGGNDILDNPNFSNCIAEYPGAGSTDYFTPFLDNQLADIEKYYRKLLTELQLEFGTHIKVIGHLYDYPIPRLAEPVHGLLWLAPELRNKKYPEHEWQNVTESMIDKFADVVRGLERDFRDFFILVDSIGAVGNEPRFWFDEIHPANNGFHRVSERIKPHIH